ncbi:o-succinylbenzoate synthase [Flavobacterium aciduliphilum]|uniref:O-succinylbenzoate synthase n=1 Tax=Flavobacterium aciduliphilum TaxID=1101402 RepID=A0A328Y9R7_9FLAO|nr:o-succinylbenzoate synthase [Flavobacterium aciduliphilum]RAR70659.1 o-succinylbenzoate synthase [Flavobacterium aciduliphilum]
MKATYHQYILDFKQPSGTSRGVLTQKETWFLIVEDEHGKKGIGECGLLIGLSVDDQPDYQEKLQWVCDHIYLGSTQLWEKLRAYPSIQFGVEMAFQSLSSHTSFELFPTAFTRGEDAIAINGLIWMGTPEFMKSQIEEKLAQGFHCIKLKIGAIDFEQELELIASIRRHFDATQIEIRLDANGAFEASNALDKLIQLSEYEIHSIEQPIKKNQLEAMASLCQQSPIPIALDEELIGVFTYEEKEQLVQQIKPQYIILKPSFIGGFKGTQEWIDVAQQNKIGWWITSALESNIGLNAIAQWTYTLKNPLPQGLGTGTLYHNNFISPLEIAHGNLHYKPDQKWQVEIDKTHFF